MSDYQSASDAFSDLERPHPIVTESSRGPEAEPLAMRLGDLWSDFIRAGDDARDPNAPKGDRARGANPSDKARYVIPLLDDMKGILQWD